MRLYACTCCAGLIRFVSLKKGKFVPPAAALPHSLSIEPGTRGWWPRATGAHGTGSRRRPSLSTLAGNPPAIIVTYSEPMKAAEVTNPANYLLFNSGGDPITINSVAPHPGMPTGYDIFYNSNDPLPADTYTLFVRGDQIHDVDD